MDHKGRLIPFAPPVSSTSTLPSETPSGSGALAPTYEVFEYQGYAVVSGPLFNVIMLALQHNDPGAFVMVKDLFGADHIA